MNIEGKKVQNGGSKIRIMVSHPDLHLSRSSRPVTLDDIQTAINDIVLHIVNTLQSGMNFEGSGTIVDISIYGGYSGAGSRCKAFNAEELKKNKGKIK